MKSTVWLALLFVFGCSRGSAPIADVAPAISVTDSLGRTVNIAKPAKRIVSMSSSNTEVLFALGLDDEILGVTEFCTYPDAANAKPKIGQFAPQTFNVERIAALKPDLVLATGELHRPVIESLERLGIQVAGFQGESFDEIFQTIDRTGKLVGRDEAAKGIVDSMKKSLATVADRVRGKSRPKVFYLVSDDPLMTAGKKSMITDAISRAGGENVFADVDGDYPRINDEEVLKRNPEIVLVPNYGHDGKTQTPKALASLDAVKANRVYTVDADTISRPSPRLVKAVEGIAERLHPKR